MRGFDIELMVKWSNALSPGKTLYAVLSNSPSFDYSKYSTKESCQSGAILLHWTHWSGHWRWGFRSLTSALFDMYNWIHASWQNESSYISKVSNWVERVSLLVKSQSKRKPAAWCLRMIGLNWKYDNAHSIRLETVLDHFRNKPQF